MTVVLVAGCRRDDGIREYEVPTTTSVQPELGLPKPQKVPAGPLTGGTDAWFFKMMGPTDDVLKSALSFAKVVQSLKFAADGTPEYDIPEGWSAKKGPAPRYQTLTAPDTTPPLELAVSTLPVMGSSLSEYMFSNINRWREQIGLEKMEQQNWIETARSQGELVLSAADSHLVAMVNLSGETKETGPTRMLAAIVITMSGDEQKKMPAPESKSPVEFETPQGWKETAGNAMRMASLEANPEGGKVDISVTRLGGGGDVLSNLNRWREQVKLDPIEKEKLESESKSMKIAGRDGTYVEAIGPTEGILAAIVTDGEAKWFFKAQGPVAAIESERERFKEFLTSVKLP